MAGYNIHIPKEEVDRVFKESFRKLIDEILDAGLPVRTVDEEGVYDYYKDGRKVYVKRYTKEE